MSEVAQTARRSAMVGHALGLHIRPASQFVEVAHRFAAEIIVRLNGVEANGKSILELMCLAAGCGAMLELEARGHDAPEAVAVLSALIEPSASE